jgi:oligopeptide transport system substrate-binding protein
MDEVPRAAAPRADVQSNEGKDAMKTSKAWLLLAMLALGLGLVAAGCGGGDDNAASDEGAVQGGLASQQVLTLNWGAEPPSLDPGLATDTTSSNVLVNIMDPLIKLGDDLKPVPNLAESWKVSKDGKTVTFKLRSDGKWTNGDPVTAEDFEWSWKRTISPELAADYAYQFYGIVGAQEYNGCKSNCEALRDKVGITALDDRTLEVKLTTPQPWFVQQVAHTSFLAVNRKAVERWGSKWTEAKNIVTNGPFKLAAWRHSSELNLVKWDAWRDAKDVKLTLVNGRMITDGTTAVQAFEAGEIDVNPNIPPEEIPRLKETSEYAQDPGLGTYYYGINTKNIPDVNQRRAMSLAINRQEIIDNIAQADQTPSNGFTPQGMPGFDVINPKSKWEPADGNMDEAKALMAKVANPKKNITLLLNDSPGHREIAVAIQAAWKELGLTTTIKQQEWAQFLEFLGPPPDPSVDVYRNGWIGDYVDAINFLELWTCTSGNNNSNFCNKRYDGLVAKARQTQDNAARYKIYAQLEQILGGPNGEMPMIPIYWYTYVDQERESVKDTYKVNLLNQTDLTKVEIRES